MVYFISGNEGKKAEVSHIFAKHNVLSSLQFLDIDLIEIQGTSKEIIVAKCHDAIRQKEFLRHEVFFVEDTSLSLSALNGFPGPYVKWLEKSMGLSQIYNTVHTLNNCSASVTSTIGLYADGNVSTFEGIVYGEIVPVQNGSFNFGFDPIFKPLGEDTTFSRMSRDRKCAISHRTIALNKLIKQIDKIVSRAMDSKKELLNNPDIVKYHREFSADFDSHRWNYTLCLEDIRKSPLERWVVKAIQNNK